MVNRTCGSTRLDSIGLGHLIDNIDRGIVLGKRKVGAGTFCFQNVGQQYALSYLIGELHVEFVDKTKI